MSTIDQLIGGPSRATRPAVARGRVTRAPQSNTDYVRVALINYSSTHDYEVPAPQWASLPGDLPVVGDLCVVMFDEEGDAWIPVWDGEPVIDPGTTFPGIPVFAQATQPTSTPPWAWIKTNTNPPELWVEDGVAPVGQVQ